MFNKTLRLTLKITGVIFLFSLISLGGAGNAFAFRVNDIEFKDQYQIGSFELSLRGAGIRRFLAMRVVAVGLYLPGNISSNDVLKDIPKSLEVVYLQNILAAELRRATIRGIRSNVSNAEFIELEQRIKQINSYYPNVQRMDRIRVSYVPEYGTTVELNGQVKGVIQGADFGKAFFSIWVGQRPVDARMKNVLLSQNGQSIVEIGD